MQTSQPNLFLGFTFTSAILTAVLLLSHKLGLARLKPLKAAKRAALPLSLAILTLALSTSTSAQNVAPQPYLPTSAALAGTGYTNTPIQGNSVAISSDGSTAVEGASEDNSGVGGAWVFIRTSGIWSQQGSELIGTGAGSGQPRQGISVAISADGNTILVGAYGDGNNLGAAWVYTRSSGTWTQQGAKLVPSDASGSNVNFGQSVALSADGNTAVIGGQGDNNAIGATWVFTRTDSTWTQQGNKLVGTGYGGCDSISQGFAVAVSADGNTLATGGPNDDNEQGSIWMFTRTSGTWSQQGNKLQGAGAIGGYPYMGASLALSGDGATLLMGGEYDNYEVGAVWPFALVNGSWVQQGPKLIPNSGYVIGASVGLSYDGNTGIVGVPFNGAGEVYVYTRSVGVWSPLGGPLQPAGATGNYGVGDASAISADGSTIIIGGPDFNGGIGAAWIYGQQLPFPATNVGSSTTEAETIEFPSSFTLGNIQVVTQGLTNLDFTLASSQPATTPCTVTTAYSAGDVCSISIQFAPTAPGPRQGAVLFYDNASPANLVATMYISAEGLAAQPAFRSALIITAVGSIANLQAPQGIAVDSALNVFVADLINNVVSEVSVTGNTAAVVAGNGSLGTSGDGGLATSAQIQSVQALALDGAGNLYIAQYNSVVRKVTRATGIITTVAGNGTGGYSGDGGLATAAELGSPSGLAVDGSGNLYIADSGNNVIREVNADTGIISTIAGSSEGTGGYTGDGGLAINAELNYPLDLSLDTAGNLYIADDINNVIRKVTASTGVITTVVGSSAGTSGYSGDGGLATSATLNDPQGITVDSAGNLYITDSSNRVVRKVSSSTGIINTIAGTGAAGYSGDNGPAVAATFIYPVSPVLDPFGDLFVIDAEGGVVRAIGSVAPLAYGTVNVGADSSAQDVTLMNDGSSALTLTSLTASTNFNLGGSDTTCTGSTSLNPGASCVLGVEFAPEASGSLSGSVALIDNAGSQNIPLSGTGFGVSLTATTTTITASPNPGAVGQQITFTITVSPTPSAPAGTVNVYNGETLLGNATVNSSGVATYSTSSLAAGAYNITATYSGNSTFATSISSALSLTVAAATYTVTAPQTPFALTQGGSVNITITVPPLGSSYNSVVTMSATGLPAGATATFNPPTVTPGSTGATTVMTIQLAKASNMPPAPASPAPAPPASGLPLSEIAALVALLMATGGAAIAHRRFRWLKVAFATGALASAALLFAGCNGGLAGGSSTPTGNYTITVVGTSGAYHPSTTVTLEVQ